jgi:hypothetical protein
MKLMLVFSAVLVCALCSEQNPGFKIRVTQEAIKELMRTQNGLVSKNWRRMKDMFREYIKDMRWPSDTGVLSSGAVIKHVDLLNYNTGEGSKVEFQAPNEIKASHRGVDCKVEMRVQDSGRTGTITVDMTNLNAMLKVGLSSQEGRLQLRKSACELSVDSVKVDFEGFGAEKDREYTRKAQEQIDRLISTLGTQICPRIEMALSHFNLKSSLTDCRVPLPFARDELRFSLCLVRDPKVTPQYVEFSFCGATTPSSQTSGRPTDYRPSPLEMSGSGVSRMLYLWESQDVHNYLLKQLFKRDKLRFRVTEEDQPEIAGRIRDAITEYSRETNSVIRPSSKIETTFNLDKAPAITFNGDKQSQMRVWLRLRTQHRIESDGEERTMGAVFDMEGNVHFDFETESGSMLPQIKCRVEMTRLNIEETSETLSPQVRSRMESTGRKNLESTLNRWLQRYCDAIRKYEREHVEDYMRVVRIEDFEVKALDKSIQVAASAKFDVDRLNELPKILANKAVNTYVKRIFE